MAETIREITERYYNEMISEEYPEFLDYFKIDEVCEFDSGEFDGRRVLIPVQRNKSIVEGVDEDGFPIYRHFDMVPLERTETPNIWRRFR